MLVLAIGLVATMACGSEAAAPTIVEKEVIREVQIPTIVEKEVIKIVEVEVPVTVEKIVEVEKPIVVTKEVVKEVILIATPTPVPAAAAVAAGELGAGPRVALRWNVSNLRTGTPGDTIEATGWARKLERMSGGRMEVIDRFSEEAGVSIFQMLTLLRSGLVDITTGGFAMASGEFPIGEGGDLPGLHKDMAQGMEIMDAFVPAIQAKFAKAWNAKFLAVFPIPPQVLYCNGDPRGFADLAGMKVRVYSAATTDFFNYVGAQPTAISFGEVYTALERGVVDCGLTGTNAALGAGWHEVTDTLINVPILYSFNFYAASLDAWDRFPSDVTDYLEYHFANGIRKAVVDDVANTAVNDVACLTGSDACPDGWRGGAKGSLFEVTRSPADSTLIANALVDVVLPGWIDRCGSDCKDIWNQTVAPIVGFTAK